MSKNLLNEQETFVHLLVYLVTSFKNALPYQFNWGIGTVNRKEALVVLHEIDKECRETIIATCVSLDSLDSRMVKDGRGYRIKMKCELDSYARQCLNPILQRNGLTTEEENGYVIIRRQRLV